MKQSIGYTATLNIIIIFIVVVFTFVLAALNYYKAFKVSNAVTSTIEKYEGYNSLAEAESIQRIKGLGYNTIKVSCNNGPKDCTIADGVAHSNGDMGYCVYYCEGEEGYYYKIRTNMFVTLPVVNNVLPFKVYSTSNVMYDFESNLEGKHE